MDSIYAQCKDGVVLNVIILNDPSLHHLFLEGFDHLINVTEMAPRPEIGWSYRDGIFEDPDELRTN